MKYFIYLLISTFIIVGCGGGDSTESNNKTNYPTVNKTITINKNKQIERITNAGKAHILLKIDTPHDIYITVTSHKNQNIKIDKSVASEIQNNYRISQNIKSEKIYKDSIKSLEFREKLKYRKKAKYKINAKLLSLNKRVVNNNDKATFYAEVFDSLGNERTVELNATARKVVKDVNTTYGKKSLVVWVADDDYKDGILSSGTVTQDMVDELADIFLKDGENNDIYDWETNIYGVEWGSDAKSYDNNLISNTDYIDILVYDMQVDNMAGFFYAKDNFIKSKEPKSNEKIMFYINSRLYVNNQKEVFTTLDHEFQHMINFYQRWVKKDIADPTWFNEMLSETTEDIMATKIKYDGPRNVDYRDGSAGSAGNSGGRYPYFNRYNYYPVTNWFSDIDDYGRVSAFGTFLIRNYGGAELLHKLMYSNKTGKDAVVEATGESDFNTILSKWSAGVMLSDKIDLEEGMPQYNFGDFKYTSYNGITYKMGSINFFNYNPTPHFDDENYIYQDGILYYKVGTNLSGDVNINVDMKAGDITIIAK